MSDILKKLENLDTLGVDEVEALSLKIREEYEIVRESEFIDLDYAKTLTEALETVGARQAELALEVEAAAAELAALDARCGVDLRFCTMAAASSEGRNSGNQQAR